MILICTFYVFRKFSVLGFQHHLTLWVHTTMSGSIYDMSMVMKKSLKKIKLFYVLCFVHAKIVNRNLLKVLPYSYLFENVKEGIS